MGEGKHAVVILGFKKKGVTVRQEVKCACGEMIAGDAPEGWFERCRGLLEIDPTLRLGADWTPEWVAQRTLFKAAHRDIPA